MADAAALTVSIIGHQTVTPAASAAIGALTSLEGAAGKVGSSMLNVAGSILKVTAAAAALGATGIVAGFTAATHAAMGFEKEISGIAAVTGATAEQIKGLSDVALQLGKDTAFSASEAAQGMSELAKAGVSMSDIMGGAARASLDLAAAGAVSVKDAAEIAANAMNVFGKSGSEMAHVADVIAGAANASAIDVNDYKFSLAAAGAVAATVGVSFEDLSTAIAVMGQAGIKGSDAGTSLKTMLLNLQPSTKAQMAAFRELGIITADGANEFFNAEGKAKSLAQIAGILQEKTKGMTDQQKLATLEVMFGTDAIRAAAIMTKAGAQGFENLAAAIGQVSAQDVANTRLDNLAGSLEKLKGSVETVAISVGLKFTPILKRMVDQLTDLVNRGEPAITKFAERAAAALDALITRVTAAAPALVGFGTAALTMGRNLVTLAQSQLPRVIRSFEQVRDFFVGGGAGGIAAGASGLVGGLVGAFREIGPVVQQVGQQIVRNITDTLRFLTDRVIPPLVSIILQTAAAFERTLAPAAAAVGATMRGILADTLDWLAQTAWPPLLSIIEQTANFLTQTVLPTLPAVANALRTTLGETVQWLATDVWPKLRVAADLAWTFISGSIVPGIPVVVRLLRDVLGGALQWIGQTGWPALVKGAQAAWTFLQDKVIPVVRDTVDWLRVKLPQAIEAVTGAFEAIRGKVEPIVRDALNGDIIAAIKGLASAFGEFAVLAAGWIGEQVARIDWAGIWARATTIATALGTYLLGLAVDFATWLGQQVAAIPWAQVWAQIVDAGTALGTYLLGVVVDFATWLGQQVAAIPWATVWQSIVDAATTLAAYLETLAVDFSTWLGQQVALIDWDAVWANTKLTATQVIDAIATAVGRLDAELTRWLQTQLETTDWHALGVSFGQLFGGAVLTGGQTAVDELGPQLKPETIRKALADFFVGVFSGLWAEVGPVLQKGLQDTIDNAIRAVTPTRPNWWPQQIPFPFGPQPGGGMQFPVRPPDATGSGGNVMSMPSGYTGHWERRAWEHAVRAGHPDPAAFVEQMRVESAGFAEDVIAGRRRGGQGEIGIAQILPQYHPGVDPFDPEAALGYAASHQARAYQQYGSLEAALTAYNAGGSRVGNPPASTQRYISTILANANAQRQAGVAPGMDPAALTNFRQTQQEWTQNARDANAICGPYLASLFSDAVGRPPTPEEARALGERMGVYSPTRGILNASMFDEYATALIQQANPGSTATVGQLSTAGMTNEQIAALGQQHLGSGLVGFNTPGHYFGATAYRAEDQRFNVGGTGLSLSGGKEWMSIAEMEALMGQITNVITLTNEAGTAFTAMGQQVATATQEAANMTPALSNIGASIDPVVAGFTEGTTSVTAMTDAIIASAAEQGVGAQSAAAYAAGLTTQDAAMRAVLEGFAATTPAAAELLAQLDAGTISTDQAAVAFAGLATSTATSTGAIVASTDLMKTGVTTNFDLMAAGAQIATTTLGDQVLTTITDTAGNSVATWTTMAGEVISQTATMASGVVVSTADMSTQMTATFDELAGTTTTTITDMAGNTVTTITDMAGNVVGQYVSMAEDAGSAVTEMGETTVEQFKDVASEAQDAISPIEEFGDALKDIPQADMSDSVRQFNRAADAARAAARRIKELAEATESLPGNFGGSRGGSIFGRRHSGGPVEAGVPYLVGKTGAEELFIPSQSGQVVTGRVAQDGGKDGVDEDRLARAIARELAPLAGRGDLNVYGAGTEEVVRRVRDELEREAQIIGALRGV